MMPEYVYKGFKIHYEIKSVQQSDENLYEAYGYVVNDMEGHALLSSQKFHTVFPTKVGVQHQIKKIIEDYIDFEWREFLELQKER